MLSTFLLPAAGVAVMGAPAVPFLALYRWDAATWPERVAVATVERARRLGYALPRRTPAERALADLAVVHARHPGLEVTALPPAGPVVRDPLTQPVMARAVPLRHPARPAHGLPTRRPLLARLTHHRRPA